jgi:hypothetical protein
MFRVRVALARGGRRPHRINAAEQRSKYRKVTYPLHNTKRSITALYVPAKGLQSSIKIS